MVNVTVIGKNSFLAKTLAQNPDTQNWIFLKYKEALSETDWVKDCDVVINCAFHPDFRTQEYSPIKDIDFLLAGYILRSNAHYIMLSSRAVYGDNPKNHIFTEDMAPNPENAYGQNKLSTEQSLAELLPPERLTILRNANIFGSEYERSTFFGLMLTSLKDDGVLRFNIAPDAVRDFLSARKWAEDIVKIAQEPKAGIFNLGSGHGTTTQELADLLIQFNGGGDIEFTGDSYSGQFVLDMHKTKEAFNLAEYTRSDFENDVKDALK